MYYLLGTEAWSDDLKIQEEMSNSPGPLFLAAAILSELFSANHIQLLQFPCVERMRTRKTAVIAANKSVLGKEMVVVTQISPFSPISRMRDLLMLILC